jgi:crotonobetainyl-CoA:carnitine CoA-transferase CaiB-like acyl-CoA transferase
VRRPHGDPLGASLLEEERFVRSMPRRGIRAVRNSKRNIVAAVAVPVATQSRASPLLGQMRIRRTDTIEQRTSRQTKSEAMDSSEKQNTARGPVPPRKEIAKDAAPRAGGAAMRVDRPVRVTFLTAGNPVEGFCYVT